MKKLVWIAGAAALMAGCATTDDEAMAPAAMDAAAAPADAPGMAAPAYMQSAASGDLFEIESSRLALTMSQNPQVRSFAQMLIADHTRMSQQMIATAQSAGLPPPPPQLLPHHQQALQRLQAAGGPGFDAAFKAEQITAHQEALNLHQTYASQGDVPALRALASQAVPIIQGHLVQAQQMPEMTAPPIMSEPQTRAGERGR